MLSNVLSSLVSCHFTITIDMSVICVAGKPHKITDNCGLCVCQRPCFCVAVNHFEPKVAWKGKQRVRSAAELLLAVIRTLNYNMQVGLSLSNWQVSHPFHINTDMNCMSVICVAVKHKTRDSRGFVTQCPCFCVAVNQVRGKGRKVAESESLQLSCCSDKDVEL